MLDLVIRGAEVVDGTGAPRRRADVGIRDGRIEAVREGLGPARRTLDAEGAVLAPGFVDVHTHYDAQVFFDPTLSPSPLHGVTTAIGGNCGFSIAPLVPEAAPYLARMLARVEGMPLESLEAGVPWDWGSFGEYLDRIEGTLAIHAGFLVGHSTLRRVAMGERAVGERATPEDLETMGRLLEESLRAGALGFSSSLAPTHNDAEGRPVPSRHATGEELLALASRVARHPGTTLEFIPTVGPFSEAVVDLMTELSLAARRPLNWNVLGVSSWSDLWREQLRASDVAAERGARVVALTLPQVMTLRLNFRSGFVLDAFPGWGEVLSLPLAERKAALADPAVRERMLRGAHSEEAGVFRALAGFEKMRIDEAFTEAGRAFEGRTVGELAAARGVEPFDALLDLAVAEDLRTSFMPQIPGDDEASWKARAEAWLDPRTVVGGSDAGAHLDMIDTFSFTTALLGPAVRDRGLLSLEEAVHQLTEVPARLLGLRGRGRIAPGAHADLVLFDPSRIGPGRVRTQYDLPGGAGRLTGGAHGILRVLVAGREVVVDGELTDQRPGAVLRSGRDTETVLCG